MTEINRALPRFAPTQPPSSPSPTSPTPTSPIPDQQRPSDFLGPVGDAVEGVVEFVKGLAKGALRPYSTHREGLVERLRQKMQERDLAEAAYDRNPTQDNFDRRMMAREAAVLVSEELAAFDESRRR